MEQTNSNLIRGKIIKLSDKGWGFINSLELKFTRIFFHWTDLRQDTSKFPELRVGMTVEFIPIRYQEQGWRAIKIKVIAKEPKHATHTEGVSEGGK